MNDLEGQIIDMLSLAYENSDGDVEVAHGDYDDIISTFLRTLGYEKLADYYDGLEKWYS